LQKVSIGPPSVLVSTPKIIGQRADGNPGRHREGFPRLEGLAESAPVDVGGLSDHGRFSARRTVRTDQSTARCSSSIPANLAEGCGRNGDAEFARFCSIAMGSASELEYHLLLAKDLKLIKPKDYAEQSQRTIELKRMLTALLQKLNADR
jgi:four helix bundle protein